MPFAACGGNMRSQRQSSNLPMAFLTESPSFATLPPAPWPLASPLSGHAACNTMKALMSQTHPVGGRRPRVIIAKPGLDGHDRGAKVIARALTDAGMEVIYTGLRQTPEQIVTAAVQEDADVIGLSILSGAHLHICRRVMELVREQKLDDVSVLVGGIIPDADVEALKAVGITGIFPPGSPMQDIIDFIRRAVQPRVGTI